MSENSLSGNQTPTDQPGSAFTVTRRPVDLAFRRTTLVSREWLGTGYVKVRVQGESLRGFGAQSGVDDHVRLFFIDDLDVADDAIRDFPSREFTPLAWGDDWVDFEFVSHGDEGVAGVWGATAPIGSPLAVAGPRGSVHFDGAPDAWFLAGDESAIAQIRRYAAAIPAGATARIVVEVADASCEIAIDAPVPVEFVYRDGRAASAALIGALDALGAADRPAGSVFGFVAAEKAVVPAGRALLLDRWGLSGDDTVIKGYWKGDEPAAGAG